MFYEDPDFNGGLNGNPSDSKKEAAWDEAQSRYKQHKNNEKALKVGINQNKADEAKDMRAKKRKPLSRLFGKQKNPFAIATAKAKEMGYTSFSENSEGDKKRDEIAESIKEQQKMRKQYEELEDKWEDTPTRRGGDFAGHSKSRKIHTGKGQRGIKKQENSMVNTDAIVKSVLIDLADKGLYKDHPMKKMSIPAIAGLLGAGAMLGKVFKLEDDDDDETIAKQVTAFMGDNSDFFEELAEMCDFICSTKEGEESSDESRGNHIMEAASAFHKACNIGGGAAPGGGSMGIHMTHPQSSMR